MPSISDIENLGQSIWYDYLRRAFIESGELSALIKQGLRGVTSNPTIFEKAIEGSTDYNDAIKSLSEDQEKGVREIYEALVLEDISKAADAFRPVFDRLQGADGFVSIEVDPKLSKDSEGMVNEAKRYFRALNRPNVMIKIPATDAGFPAIKELTSEGINVNVTLIFSIKQYEAAAKAYIAGLEIFSKTHEDLSKVHSVASFFVSRVDTMVDKLLEERGEKELQGKIGNANAKLAYRRFKQLFKGKRWDRLASKKARVQRVLWASTSTKNPSYPDTLYVDALIGRDTINTITPETLKAALNHSKLFPDSVEKGINVAKEEMAKLAELGIDFDIVAEDLENEGISKFTKSIDSLFEKLMQKRDEILAEPNPEPAQSLGNSKSEIDSQLHKLSSEGIVKRIWNGDYTVWKSEPNEIVNRLGWLSIAEKMQESVPSLREFLDDLRLAGYTQSLLLGMGGSSLAPLTFAQVFGVGRDFLPLSVLDSTDSYTIASAGKELDFKKTLFIVSSKSGGTIETLSLFKYFYLKMIEVVGREKAGEHFVAITDPNTQLVDLARRYNFRKTFVNDPNIGGRYSALSHFGLVPAALMGVDLSRLLDNALSMAAACDASVHIEDNPGAWLGAFLGQFAKMGRNKVTIVSSDAFEGLPPWIEQLLAESTGKEGMGILPIVGEGLADPEVYANDRVFVSLTAGSDNSFGKKLQDLENAGYPVVRLSLRDPYEVGKQFFQWEFATAIAGHILGINPFDQPDVESAKEHTRKILFSLKEKGTFPPAKPSLVGHGLSIFGRDGSNSTGEVVTSVGSFIENNAKAGAYLALQAYLEQTPETDRVFDSIRTLVRQKYKIATTMGYGPRFLHSTGQEHKGDAGNGIFLQFTRDDLLNLPIPDSPDSRESSLTFGQLLMAEALGDFNALREKGRHVMRIHLETNVGEGLEYVKQGLSSSMGQKERDLME